jgi:ADP-heptose:LPS heptosyltransferase
MLIWPALALLKQVSNAHISVLVPAYTAPMAHLCPSIDAVIIDPGPQAERGAQKALVQHIKDQQFDSAIAVFSNGRNARLLWQANIPNRFAPATKWAQILYNHRLRQRRSQSAQPEWRYNVDLIRFALKQQGYKLPENEFDAVFNGPYLKFEPQVLEHIRQHLATNLGINANHRWLIVHPGTGGSARNLIVAQYAQFLHSFVQPIDQSSIDLMGHNYKSFDILVTAGPNETELAQTLVQALLSRGLSATVLTSNDGLKAFAQVIANGALFLASSTGPLHMAGALDMPTIGIYSARLSATALRWQPINQPSHHYAISVPSGARDPEDLTAIDWVKQGVQSREWFMSLC